MKVLMFSTDRFILDSGSEPRKRMLEYASLFQELHIIVYAKEKNQPIKEGNLFIYSTTAFLKPFYFWQAYKTAKKIIVSESASDFVISCQDPFETGMVGWFLKLRLGLKLQIQVHTDIFSIYFRGESIKNRIRFYLAKFILPRADIIRVVSERIKNSLAANCSSLTAKIYVLPIFVDVDKIKSAEVKIDLHKKYPEADYIILMASRITKEKNIGLAIEAMAEINREFPRAMLLVVGDGPEKLKLKAEKPCLPATPRQRRGSAKAGPWAGREKLKTNIVFESWANDLASYYKSADIFLLTSNYEGYGRTVVEAMAAGLPVVMTNVGLAGERLINGTSGIITPVGDAKAVVDAIKSLLPDKAKREKISLGAIKAASHLGPKEEYLDFYKKTFNS